MATNNLTLSENDRTRLDGIVQKMTENKEPDSNIQAVVNDFKQKYGKPLTAKETLMQKLKNAGVWAEKNVVRPTLEYGGMAAGAIAGAPLDIETGGMASVGGAGLGYAGGKKLSDIIEEKMGIRKPKPLGKQLIQSGKDVVAGAGMEAGGQIAGKVIPAVMKVPGRLLGSPTKQLLGLFTGTGERAVNEALTSSPAFKDALRGKISGDEVVENAKSALSELKNQRASAYQGQLAEITKNDGPISDKPFRDKLAQLMKQYRVEMVEDPETGEQVIDTSRIAMGAKGRSDIAAEINLINKWGSKPGDNTALGLDALKRQLDDFYSESSQARQFVQSLRDSVKKTITDAVPQYGDMTKDYEEATKLIKDMESGLMLRQKGMSGRIIGDQTLRRLVSSMRDNFKLRGELVNILGTKAGSTLESQIAGYAMSSWVPQGIVGRGMMTGDILAATIMRAVRPEFWPTLAISSPRVVGEFLMTFGKGMEASAGAGKVASKLLGYKITPYLQMKMGEAAKKLLREFANSPSKRLSGANEQNPPSEGPSPAGPAVPIPPGTAVKPLDEATAQKLLDETGGDVNKARELARQKGFSLE